MHMDMQNTYAWPYRYICRVDWAQPYARNVWVTRATGKWMSATMEPEKKATWVYTSHDGGPISVPLEICRRAIARQMCRKLRHKLGTGKLLSEIEKIGYWALFLNADTCIC
jgi:hypothetical protein